MLRQRGQSDERRRRVLSEDAATDEALSSRTARRRSARSSKTSTYAEDTLQSQPQITDLVPQRAWVLALLWGAVGGLVASLLAGHHLLRPAIASAPTAILSALDIASANGLAAWVASLALACASAVAFVCFSLRRHKRNDYHGRYRVWIGTATFALLASSAVVAPWHLAMGQWLAEMAQWKMAHGPFLFWFVPTALVGGFLAIRLMLDLRGSRGTMIGLILATSAYATATAFQLGLMSNLDPSISVLIVYGSRLGGHALLLLSLVTAARYILLDAQGLVPERVVKEKKRAKKEKASAASKAKSKRRTDLEQPAPSPPKGRSDLEPTMPATRQARDAGRRIEEEDDYEKEPPLRASRKKQRKTRARVPREEESYDDSMYDDEPGRDPHRMSKSERKRLRKLKAQQRHAA